MVDYKEICDVNASGFSECIENCFSGVRVPLFGTIEISNYCNFKCIHCYNSDIQNTNKLDFADICKIIDEATDEGMLCLAITGGEPLLHPNFNEIYIYAKRKGLLVSVFSNASAIKEEHIELFKKYPLTVFSTTAYGYTEHTYEKITQVKGSYKKFRKGIELLSQNGIPFEIKAVALKQNKDEIFELKDWAKRLNVPFAYSYAISPLVSGSVVNRDCQLSPIEGFEFDLKDKERLEHWRNIAINGVIKDESYFYKSLCINENRIFLCAAAFQSFFISAEGMFYICHGEKRNPYDLIKGSFNYAWNVFAEEIRLRKAVREKYNCLNCDKIDFCNPCAAKNELIFGSPYTPDAYFCEIAQLRKDLCENIK